MLNKLHYFKSLYEKNILIDKASEDLSRYEEAKNKIEQYFLQKESSYKVKKVGSPGRSSYSFLAVDSLNNARFIKCSIPERNHVLALEKEFRILSKLYDYNLELIRLDGEISFIMMDQLFPLENDFDYSSAGELISGFKDCLNSSEVLNLPSTYDIGDLLIEAKDGLVSLYSHHAISQCCFQIINSLFDYLETEFARLPRILCHGDFGLANCMTDKNGQIVLIDWEDAFLGTKNYDLCYWTTFMNHRNYYENLLGTECRDRKYNTAVIVMIIVLKEYISFLNGQIRQNKTSCEERLEEVLEYLK